MCNEFKFNMCCRDTHEQVAILPRIGVGNCRKSQGYKEIYHDLSPVWKSKAKVSQRSRDLAKCEQDDDDQEDMVQVRHEAQEEGAKMWIHNE